jgi:hypothetical protein
MKNSQKRTEKPERRKTQKGRMRMKLAHVYDYLQWCSVCDPAKIFLISSYLLFSNPTHKTETGTTNRWVTTNSNPPGQIKLSSQSETGIS